MYARRFNFLLDFTYNNSGDYMGRYKKYLAILLMFSIHMMPFNVVRATTVADDGWSVSKRLVQGATTFYDGTKNIILNGKNYAAAGTAAITPTAGQVAKMIVRTGAALAVSVAIEELIGAVDYVMDPANNRVKYYAPPSNINDPSLQYYYECGTFKDVSAQAACSASYKAQDNSFKKNTVSNCRVDVFNSDGTPSRGTCDVAINWTSGQVTNTSTVYYVRKNPAYVPNSPPASEEKYLPYEAVASQVISDAMAEKADPKAYVSSVADTALQDEQKQIVPASDVTQQLNNSQSIPTTNTAQGQAVPQADPNNPSAPKAPPTDITINFPVFCGWAPTVCQAAQSAIEFPKTAKNWWDTASKAASSTWTDIQEWVKDPENPDNTLDLDDQPQTEPNTQINFSTSCPAKIPLNFSWNGQSLDFSFDFSIWCESISTFVYPIVVALGALHALYIVSGVREDG